MFTLLELRSELKERILNQITENQRYLSVSTCLVMDKQVERMLTPLGNEHITLSLKGNVKELQCAIYYSGLRKHNSFSIQVLPFSKILVVKCRVNNEGL